MQKKFYEQDDIKLCYYEVENSMPPLVLIHAQGVDSRTYEKVAKKLAKKYHVYAVDCYGHGSSLHDVTQYNIKAIGDAIATFIAELIGDKVYLLGHSSGGLIAAYIAAETQICEKLILEDPPFFACQGERRKSTFNYVDLSTVCHKYLQKAGKEDFVLYYFARQYAWNFFPAKSREQVRGKLLKAAEKFRRKHPDRDLQVPFWPKVALAGFQGMNAYDPRFGEAFYTDSFHADIPHEEILSKITCETVFMKAKSEINAEGLLMGALSDEDAAKVAELIGNCRLINFACGHGIHIEKPKAFIEILMTL